MRFWNFKNQADPDTGLEQPVLTIQGDIVDDDLVWAYEWFGMQCTAPNAFKQELANYNGKDITVWIDSFGGSVFAAAGIYNALMEHKGHVTVKIDGKAMSAASVIAMAGGEILMSPVAMLMIHDPMSSIDGGNAAEFRRAADVLDEVKNAIINAYQLKTGRSRAKIAQMMSDETYMSAKTAISEGFADGMLYSGSPDASPAMFGRYAMITAACRTPLDVAKVVALQNCGNEPEGQEEENTPDAPPHEPVVAELPELEATDPVNTDTMMVLHTSKLKTRENQIKAYNLKEEISHENID